MRKLWAIALALIGVAAAGALSGCSPYYYGYPPTHCVGVWVPGHYGPYGYWHRGYWRCA
jgi:hypothetical protein